MEKNEYHIKDKIIHDFVNVLTRQQSITNDNKYIVAMMNEIDKINATTIYEKSKQVIYQIMQANNGVFLTKMADALQISRQYISMMEKAKEIEKISRGVYNLPNTFKDSYYVFQQKYKKSVFSHMNSLYFHGLTEEFPGVYTVSIPKNYHVDGLGNNANVFYVDEGVYDIGLCEVKTPNGNKVIAYDIERCICDIIRSKSRMDMEQVKKSLRLYAQSKEKNLIKLSEYSKKMGIYNKVMEQVGMYIE